jgi:branched-chain amino acid transport system substrate-binding protein
MKRYYLLFSAVILFLVIGCNEEIAVYRIGAIVPLTGDAEAYGQVVKSGLSLALEEINAGGGIKSKPLDIFFEDDATDPNKAIQKANGLIQASKVPLLIGGITSTEALALAPVCEKSKTILLSPSASSPKLSGIGQYFFRNYPSDTLEAPVMAEYAVRKMKIRNVAILYIDKDYGQGLEQVFKKRFTELGGTVTYEKGYAVGTTDFAANITELKANAPDALYLPGYYTEIAAILKELDKQKLKIKVISSGGMASPRILEMAEETAEGAIFPAAPYDPKSNDQSMKKFVAAYKKKFLSEPDVYAAYAYDALKIVAKAIEACSQYPQDLRSHMADVNYHGVTGEISFDQNGDVSVTPRLFQVKDGKFVPAP